VSGFRVKTEANAWAISPAKLREIAFSEIFYKSICFEFIFQLGAAGGGGVVCQTDFT
jgi:hypothetical protein